MNLHQGSHKEKAKEIKHENENKCNKTHYHIDDNHHDGKHARRSDEV